MSVCIRFIITNMINKSIISQLYIKLLLNLTSIYKNKQLTIPKTMRTENS